MYLINFHARKKIMEKIRENARNLETSFENRFPKIFGQSSDESVFS